MHILVPAQKWIYINTNKYICSIYLTPCGPFTKNILIEGSLEVKLPTILTDENAGAWKGRKVAKHCVFPMICGSGGSKSRLAKAASAEPSGQMRDEKLHAVVARSTFEVKSAKNWSRVRTTFGRSDVVLRGRRKGIYAPCQKWEKTSGFCSGFKSVGRRGAFEEDLERCISRGTRGTRDMFMRDVRRSGHWFPERVCILEHQISRFAKMILRDRCSTSLASLFSWHAQYQMEWKIAKRIGTRSSARHSSFHF